MKGKKPWQAPKLIKPTVEEIDPDAARIGVGDFQPTPYGERLLIETYQKGRLSQGALVGQVESMFAALHGAAHGIACGSGTDALIAAWAVLKERNGWEDGSRVIVPATTFIATMNAIIINGLVPELVDIDPDTYNLSPELVQRTLEIDMSMTGNPKPIVAICPVHLFGQMADMRAFHDLALKYDLWLVEDSCEAIGATNDGVNIGELSAMACLSFYVAHMATAGVGGMVLTNSRAMADMLRSVFNHGRNVSYWNIDQRGADLIVKRFRFERLGLSSRMTELQAAVLLADMSDITEKIAVRIQNAMYLSMALQRFAWQGLKLPYISPLAKHVFMMYPLMLQGEGRQAESLALQRMLELQGIETRPLMPILEQPWFGSQFNPDNFPNAKAVQETGFYIGCHPGIGGRELARIVDAFDHFFNGKHT